MRDTVIEGGYPSPVCTGPFQPAKDCPVHGGFLSGIEIDPSVPADVFTNQLPPTRATTLPTDGKERKRYPVASGVLDYFPDAIVAVARVSQQGNDQHNPGQPLHWDRTKSTDEADTLMRHFLQRGNLDTDGIPHSSKVAWRALAILQKELENLK